MSKCKVDSLAPHYEPMPQKMFSEKEASLSTDAIFFYVMFCQVGTIYANMLCLFLLLKVTRFRADQITKVIIKIHPLNNCHIRQIKQTSSMMYVCSCRKLYRPIMFQLPFCYLKARELASFCYGETFENLQICGEIGGNAPIFNKRACQSKRKYCCRNGLQFPFYFAHRIASRLKTTVKRKKVKGKKLKKLCDERTKLLNG